MTVETDYHDAADSVAQDKILYGLLHSKPVRISPAAIEAIRCGCRRLAKERQSRGEKPGVGLSEPIWPASNMLSYLIWILRHYPRAENEAVTISAADWGKKRRLTPNEVRRGGELLGRLGYATVKSAGRRGRHYLLHSASVAEDLASGNAGIGDTSVANSGTGYSSRSGSNNAGDGTGAYKPPKFAPEVAQGHQSGSLDSDTDSGSIDKPDDEETNEAHRKKQIVRLQSALADLDLAAVRLDAKAWAWAERWARTLDLSEEDLAAVAHLIGENRSDALEHRLRTVERIMPARVRRGAMEKRTRYAMSSIATDPTLSTFGDGPARSSSANGRMPPADQSGRRHRSVDEMPEHSPGGEDLVVAITSNARARLGSNEGQWTEGLRALRDSGGWLLVARWPGLARRLRQRHAPEHEAYGVAEVVSLEEYRQRQSDAKGMTAGADAREEVRT